MFLKTSLSNTRKFISRTINSVKSFFNETTYQRLPKPPQFSCIGFDKTLSQRYGELDKFYNDSTNVHVIDDRHDSKSNTSSTKIFGGATSKDCAHEVEKSSRVDQEKNVQVCQRIEAEEEKISNSCKCVVVISEERRCLVAKKLKELDMSSDVESVLDIEEVLHYYSHLTSPVYMELFDKFFINIYADLFNFKLSRRALAHCNTFSR